MLRGRRPIPGEIREKQGNPGHRPIARQPDTAAQLAETPPFELDDLGRSIWDAYLPRLRAMGYVRSLDVHALARYCDHVARWVKLRERVAEEGETYVTESRHGTMQRMNPAFDALLKTERQIDSLEREFGLTPSSRMQIVSKLSEPVAAELPLGIASDRQSVGLGLLAPGREPKPN